MCNTYLQSQSSQKDYIICGPEFGLDNVVMVVLIKRALCGGKSEGHNFRNHRRSCMRYLEFTSCMFDSDVCMIPDKKSYGYL